MNYASTLLLGKSPVNCIKFLPDFALAAACDNGRVFLIQIDVSNIQESR